MSGLIVNTAKNRRREAYSFANINLLGKCNVNCFFCLGRDIAIELEGKDQRTTHYSEWPNFDRFLGRCEGEKVKKIYLTAQNTDFLLYAYLDSLIEHLKKQGFLVGLRTNGYEALKNMDSIHRLNGTVGYSIHTLRPVTSRMVLGRSDIPAWRDIIPATAPTPCRVSIVLNRCNEHEFWELLRYISTFPNVKYIQVRRVSTDTRADDLAADMVAYERVYTSVNQIFPRKNRLWEDADVFDIFGKDVVFWRTVRTTVNSLNYFTDGTLSDMYFVVEGYLKYREVKG